MENMEVERILRELEDLNNKTNSVLVGLRKVYSKLNLIETETVKVRNNTDRNFKGLETLNTKIESLGANANKVWADCHNIIARALNKGVGQSNMKSTMVWFKLRSMTETQVRDLLRQGMAPEVIYNLCDGKFDVKHIYKIRSELK